MSEKILILGAKSDIAISIANKLAMEGNALQLAARNVTELEGLKKELHSKHQVDVTLHEFDALDVLNHSKFVEKLEDLPIIAISTIGLLGNQKESEKNISKTILEIRSNFEGPAAIFSELANKFEKRGYGTLVGFSSVAGERGRSTNYIYGSAKAGFTEFLSGLRSRLESKGVHVMTVLPGYVSTKMTKMLKLPTFLTAKPDEIAISLLKALKKKKNIIYYLPIWRIIILFIKMIPEAIFKKLKF
tara:strand:+ start:655 stop:1389 length:735 start_codon:yes stop_codon:yes gene_type:complete